MSLLKTRPTMDALQRIMISFKQFERKLDRLQEDVSYHGKTLSDLRTLVSNLSGDENITPDSKPDEVKDSQKKTAPLQYNHFVLEPAKRRKKKAIQPFPAKLKATSLENQRNKIFEKPFHNKLIASPKVGPAKHSHKSMRSPKADVYRKANSLRTERIWNKKRSKLQKA